MYYIMIRIEFEIEHELLKEYLFLLLLEKGQMSVLANLDHPIILCSFKVKPDILIKAAESFKI